MTGLKVGDKGQRYEVRCKDSLGHEIIVGWADDPKNLVEAIKLHPSNHSHRVIDRQAKSQEMIDRLEKAQEKHNDDCLFCAFKDTEIAYVLTLLRQSKELICKWNQGEDGDYESECENRFEFLGGSSPEENGFVYCPYCGKKIRVQE